MDVNEIKYKSNPINSKYQFEIELKSLFLENKDGKLYPQMRYSYKNPYKKIITLELGVGEMINLENECKERIDESYSHSVFDVEASEITYAESYHPVSFAPGKAKEFIHLFNPIDGKPSYFSLQKKMFFNKDRISLNSIRFNGSDLKVYEVEQLDEIRVRSRWKELSLFIGLPAACLLFVGTAIFLFRYIASQDSDELKKTFDTLLHVVMGLTVVMAVFFTLRGLTKD